MRPRTRGINVTSSPDALSEQIADLALLLMLTLASRKDAADGTSGGSLKGKTLGLIGFGQIGQAVAKRAFHGFGMYVLVHHPASVNQDAAKAFGVSEASSIDELLPEADFVSLHCDLGVTTLRLINAQRLAQMKPDAVLINTAHGMMVDELALLHALWFETIGGTGISVSLNDLQRLSDFVACDNAIILPRPCDGVPEAQSAADCGTIDNVVEFPKVVAHAN